MYFPSPPLLLRKYYSSLTWKIPVNDKRIFLTFDDGPIPEVTPYVLEQLKKYNCKATFFCIGHNIDKHPQLFKQLIDDGHAIGNHTYNHLNGWKTKTAEYTSNVLRCQQTIHHYYVNAPFLFRPPYGKITKAQIKQLLQRSTAEQTNFSIIMWDVLSYDFDKNVSKEKCLKNIINNIKPGSIIVFHDSIKAQDNLHYALPQTLNWILENGFVPALLT